MNLENLNREAQQHVRGHSRHFGHRARVGSSGVQGGHTGHAEEKGLAADGQPAEPQTGRDGTRGVRVAVQRQKRRAARHRD